MENIKMTNEILKDYEGYIISKESIFEYGKGSICDNDGNYIADFSKVEICIKPKTKAISLMNSGINEGVIGYDIKVNLNITTKYSRYSKINSKSYVKLCVDDELYIENCNISYKDENIMMLNNISFENIEIEDSRHDW